MSKKMVVVDEMVPAYLDKPMQALAYWIGYEKCRYGGYKITELPLVAEYSRLVHSSLKDNLRVECEKRYEDFIKTESLFKGRRADLCIFEKDSGSLVCVIEAKLYTSSKKRRQDDLMRLLSLKKENPQVRAFLLVFSEGMIPEEYMNKKKTGANAKYMPLEVGWFYKVRRVVKASEHLRDANQKKGHYVCLLEIVQKDGKK